MVNSYLTGENDNMVELYNKDSGIDLRGMITGESQRRLALGDIRQHSRSPRLGEKAMTDHDHEVVDFGSDDWKVVCRDYGDGGHDDLVDAIVGFFPVSREEVRKYLDTIRETNE